MHFFKVEENMNLEFKNLICANDLVVMDSSAYFIPLYYFFS